MMIVQRIHNGESAEEIGIPEIQHQSWKESLDRFLQTWDNSTDFESSYRQWLIDEQFREVRESEQASESEAKTDGQEQARLTLPSLGKQAMGLLGAIGSVVSSSGPVLASPEVLEARRKICLSCTFLTDNGRCGNTEEDRRGCGCYMMNKARLAAMTCPRSFWEE